MPLQNFAARHHRRLTDLLVAVIGVAQDVVAHELEEVHTTKLKAADCLQRQPGQGAALQLA